MDKFVCDPEFGKHIMDKLRLCPEPIFGASPGMTNICFELDFILVVQDLVFQLKYKTTVI